MIFTGMHLYSNSLNSQRLKVHEVVIIMVYSIMQPNCCATASQPSKFKVFIFLLYHLNINLEAFFTEHFFFQTFKLLQSKPEAQTQPNN